MTQRRKPSKNSPTNYPAFYSPSPRQRRWERAHQSQKVVYRGVDPHCALRVKDLAAARQVSAGAVARILLAYALHAYAQGDLELQPHPVPLHRRKTLWPNGSAPHGSWRVITTWRDFPPELKQELAALASESGLQVPIGELITALLRYGLQAYEVGLLQLQPVQLAWANTVDWTGLQ